MDDLTLAQRRQRALGRPQRLCLQEAREKASGFPPTIVMIIFRSGTLRAQSRIVINLAWSAPTGVLEGREGSWRGAGPGTYLEIQLSPGKSIVKL